MLSLIVVCDLIIFNIDRVVRRLFVLIVRFQPMANRITVQKVKKSTSHNQPSLTSEQFEQPEYTEWIFFRFRVPRTGTALGWRIGAKVSNNLANNTRSPKFSTPPASRRAHPPRCRLSRYSCCSALSVCSHPRPLWWWTAQAPRG